MAGRGGREQSEPRLRVVRSEGAEDAASDVDERLSAAVADLRWKLHDIDALRWRRNLVARGAAPLVAMPRGYEHIAQVLNSKRRLDERISDVICGVAKPLLGLVGAAGLAALLASTPLLNAHLVRAFELPRSPGTLVATVPEQEARWLVPPLAAGAPVVAAGAERAGPTATRFARPVNPFSASARGTLWSSHVLGTPRARPEPQEQPGPATPQTQPAPASGTQSGTQTPAAGTATPSPGASARPSPTPSAKPGTTQPTPGTQPSPGASPGTGTATSGPGTPTSAGDPTGTSSPAPTASGSTSGTPTAPTSGTPTTSTTPTPGTSGTTDSSTTPTPTTGGTTATP